MKNIYRLTVLGLALLSLPAARADEPAGVIWSYIFRCHKQFHSGNIGYRFDEATLTSLGGDKLALAMDAVFLKCSSIGPGPQDVVRGVLNPLAPFYFNRYGHTDVPYPDMLAFRDAMKVYVSAGFPARYGLAGRDIATADLLEVAPMPTGKRFHFTAVFSRQAATLVSGAEIEYSLARDIFVRPYDRELLRRANEAGAQVRRISVYWDPAVGRKYPGSNQVVYNHLTWGYYVIYLVPTGANGAGTQAITIYRQAN